MRALPGGTFSIPEGGPERLDAIVGGDAGPLWAFMVATGGLGAEIVDQRAKEGRSGRFDLVRMEAVIEDTATCHFTYVVPRR